MARKLKTYITSIGFYEEAIAAPSMKAALEAWGSNQNLFHHGFARESNDSAVINATMKHPGARLKRPVGSKGAFTVQAELPKIELLSKQTKNVPQKGKPKSFKNNNMKAKEKITAREKKASEDYLKAEKLRKQQQEKEESVRRKLKEKREAAFAKAQQDLNNAEIANDLKMQSLEDELASINKKMDVERTRWESQKERLEQVMNRLKS